MLCGALLSAETESGVLETVGQRRIKCVCPEQVILVYTVATCWWIYDVVQQGGLVAVERLAWGNWSSLKCLRPGVGSGYNQWPLLVQGIPGIEY